MCPAVDGIRRRGIGIRETPRAYVSGFRKVNVIDELRRLT